MSATTKLASAVERFEVRCGTLDTLCCEMLATIRVNLARGTITTANDEDFERILSGWSKRISRVRDEQLSCRSCGKPIGDCECVTQS